MDEHSRQVKLAWEFLWTTEITYILLLDSFLLILRPHFQYQGMGVTHSQAQRIILSQSSTQVLALIIEMEIDPPKIII